ncbi:MAG: hypothetical protein IJS15_06985 [Victivallales bacterium]|nr:hypothetical protein [Victivallales bacterium]
MAAQSNNIRYGKPCMTDLPPRLGRQIFTEIMTAKPFDDSVLLAQNKRLIAKLVARIKKNEG